MRAIRRQETYGRCDDGGGNDNERQRFSIDEYEKPQPIGLRFHALLTEGEPDLHIERA